MIFEFAVRSLKWLAAIPGVLLLDGGASVHHVFPRSGWTSFRVGDGTDVPRAVELIRIACAYQQRAA